MKLLLIVVTILALSLTISGHNENKKVVNDTSIEEVSTSITMSDLTVPEKTTMEPEILKEVEEVDIDDKEEMEVIDEKGGDDEEYDFQLPLIATNFTGLVSMENCTVTTFKLSYIIGPLSNFRYKYVQRDGKIIYVYSMYKLNEEKIRRALLEGDRIRLVNIAIAARLHANALKEMENLAKAIEETRLRFNKMFAVKFEDKFRIQFKRSGFRINHNKRDKFMDDLEKSGENLQSEVDKLNVTINKSRENLQSEVEKLNVTLDKSRVHIQSELDKLNFTL